LQRREKEVERVIEVLAYPLEVRSSHRKDNPMLIGEDSQERFAIVGEVIRRVSTGEVPEILQGRRIVALDLERLLSRTKYSNERRKLFHSVLAEAWQPINQTILFVDEFHNLVGASGPDNDFGATVELIPALYQWHIQLIGTTKLDGCRKYVERHPSLCRRFQEVLVCEFFEEP
jgi:ATP-dependent Clp protease ATP-binding subunit ClpA